MMSELIINPVSLAFVLTLDPTSAYAYVGPGLGMGALGALLGFIVAVFLAIVGVVWYPFKRLLKKRRASKARDKSGTSDET